jgi:glycosyltransferase involved in cell wall biosynthesis
MPTHGRVGYVKRAVSSVLSQTLEDFELIILDDSSLTESEEIETTAEQDSRIRFVSRGGTNVTEARALGIQLSQGRFLTLLDSDDFWTEDRLESHIGVWSTNKIGLSWDKWAEVYDGIVQPHYQPFSEGIVDPPKLARLLYQGNFIHASAGFTETRLAKQVSLPRDIMSSDWLLFIRLTEYYPSYFINKTLSFKDTESPSRVTNTEPQAFFRRETARIRSHVLRTRPQIYGETFVREKLRPVIKRFRRTLNSRHEPVIRAVMNPRQGVQNALSQGTQE